MPPARGYPSIIPNTPSGQRTDRDRQVSWLPGHHVRSAFPAACTASGIWNDRYPVTVAGTAPDYRHEACFRVPYYFHFWKPVAKPRYAGNDERASVTTTGVTFFPGGARSAKSRLAQQLAEAQSGERVCLATQPCRICRRRSGLNHATLSRSRSAAWSLASASAGGMRPMGHDEPSEQMFRKS